MIELMRSLTEASGPPHHFLMKYLKRFLFLTCSLFSAFLLGVSVTPAAAETMPEEFVDVAQINPGIKIEMRYFSDWNFTGRTVPGYQANRCLLVKEAAEALSRVQKQLEKSGHALLVFDCYRPQKAVTSFVQWTKAHDDQKMKLFFYPDEPKAKLVARGYIDSLSGHSRGGTVDLTVVKVGKDQAAPSSYHEAAGDCRTPKGLETSGQLDMGTAYDCFTPLAATANSDISAEAKANRRLLKTAMEKAGFVNYPKEWWHYTLRGEPFKDRAFDFDIY